MTFKSSQKLRISLALLIQRNAIWGPLFYYPRSYIQYGVHSEPIKTFYPKDKDVFIYIDEKASFAMWINHDNFDGIYHVFPVILSDTVNEKSGSALDEAMITEIIKNAFIDHDVIKVEQIIRDQIDVIGPISQDGIVCYLSQITQNKYGYSSVLDFELAENDNTELVNIQKKSVDILKNMDIVPWITSQSGWPVYGGMVTRERIDELNNLLRSAKGNGKAAQYKLTGWNLEIPSNHIKASRKFVSEFN